MKDLTFIWFKQNKEEAWMQNDIPVVNLFYKAQIQLKPFDPQPYNQTTKSLVDLPINEDYEVFIEDPCGNEYPLNESEDLQYVVLNQITDSLGILQIRAQIRYLPYDFGSDLVCFKIYPSGNVETPAIKGPYYSNPFLLTEYEIERTTRVDYQYIFGNQNIFESNTPLFDGIRLKIYENNYVPATEIETYYQISKSQNVISRVNKDRRKQWCFEKVDSWHYKRLEEALYNSPCYFNQVRQYPVEGLEYEERLGDSNISENMIITDPNEDDFLNIIEVIINPEIEKVPMLASSSQVCSSSQLVSEIETVL